MSPTGPHDAIEEWETSIETLAVATTLVCSHHATDPNLWALVVPTSHQDRCSICGARRACVTFADLEVAIVEVVDQSYVTLEESGAFHDEGEWSERVEDIQDILDELLQGAVDEQLLVPLTRFVSRNNAVPYGYVRSRDLWANLYEFHEGDWHEFMDKVRAAGALKAAQDLSAALEPKVRRLFAKIAEIATVQNRFTYAQPSLWRCRQGALAKGYRQAQDLGTAPDGVASAGRLNAAGHSCFYGSTSKRGAVIESAKHGGGDAELWVGQFVASRQVFHLDVMEVPDPPSPFAPDAADTVDALEFLSRFAKTISQPNDPDDTQHYLPTQIFAAFLLA